MTDPHEYTSAKVASIASRGLRNPSSMTLNDIRAVCASVLTQARPKFRWPWERKA